jgi:hypothetical protein
MKSAKSLLAALVLLGAIISVRATPLRLEYTTANIGGGLFEYQFELSVDNNDGSFVAGQGWRGLIFGDQLGAPSLIADFAMTSPVPAPWETLGATASLTSHNGPTFAPPLHTGDRPLGTPFCGVARPPLKSRRDNCFSRLSTLPEQ